MTCSIAAIILLLFKDFFCSDLTTSVFSTYGLSKAWLFSKLNSHFLIDFEVLVQPNKYF